MRTVFETTPIQNEISQFNRFGHIIDQFENIIYKKGQILFNEGNIPRGMYYMLSGKVKIYKMGSDGKEQIIRIASQGDFIGYKSVLTETRFNCSAAVLEDASISFIPREDFKDLFKKDNHISDFFTQLLCQDLSEAEEKMVALAYKPVRGRLAEALLNLAEVYKTKINLSREDLANIVGTAKETVIRLLSEFKTENLIKTDGKLISVLDTRGLMRINHMYD